MESSLQGKRLLLLGGVSHAMEIVRAAHELGIKVYVADYNQNSPAKKIADKSFLISTADLEALDSICKEEHIDGVITGFVDSILPHCLALCKKEHFPFWGSEEQIAICSNKALFKQTCIKYSVPVAEEYTDFLDDSFQISTENLSRIHFPVVVKPTDNSGSRGVFICNNEKELIARIPQALEFSRSKTIIIEEALTGQHVNIYYTICNGDVHLSAMADRYVNYLSDGCAPQPVCLVHPSRYLAEYEKSVDEKVRKMFTAIGMRNGLAFVQGFRCPDGSFKIYEMGYRVNGGSTYALINACCKYDQLKMLIRYSLTGSMCSSEHPEQFNPHFRSLAIDYVLVAEPGSIARIEGFECIQQLPNMVRFVELPIDTDRDNLKSDSPRILAYCLFLADSVEKISETIDFIYQNVNIIDMSGETRKPLYFNAESEITR